MVGQVDLARLANFNSDSIRRYFKSSDTLFSQQLNVLEDYSLAFNKIIVQLKRGNDTSGINENLTQSDSLIGFSANNLNGTRGHASLKILFSTKNLLLQQQESLATWQERLTKYYTTLNVYRDRINAIKKDSEFDDYAL